MLQGLFIEHGNNLPAWFWLL